MVAASALGVLHHAGFEAVYRGVQRAVFDDGPGVVQGQRPGHLFAPLPGEEGAGPGQARRPVAGAVGVRGHEVDQAGVHHVVAQLPGLGAGLGVQLC